MAKVIRAGSFPPDHPIYSEGITVSFPLVSRACLKDKSKEEGENLGDVAEEEAKPPTRKQREGGTQR